MLGTLSIASATVMCGSDDDNPGVTPDGGSTGGDGGAAGNGSGGTSPTTGGVSATGGSGGSTGGQPTGGSAGQAGAGGAAGGAGEGGAGPTLPSGCPDSLDDYAVVSGTDGNDTIDAELDGRELVFALDGEDTIASSPQMDCYVGGDDADRLENGAGSDEDWVIGGAGSDTFALASVTTADHVTIIDFEAGDQLAFSEAAYGDLGTTGEPVSLAFLVKSSDFDGGTSTGEGTKGLLYNATTGKVWWDPDGAGPSESVHIATIANNAIIPDADFVVED